MDAFNYVYLPGSNQLDYVMDNGDHPNDVNHDLGDLLTGQQSGNYNYNEIGQLTSDVQEHITDIKWNASSKVTEIIKDNTDPDLEFIYGPLGNRIGKIVKPKNSNGSLKGEAYWTTTFYSLDASGNPMSIYEHRYTPLNQNNTDFKETYSLKEQQIYGSARVGVRNVNTAIVDRVVNDPNYSIDKTFTSAKVTVQTEQITPEDLGHGQRKLETAKCEWGCVYG